MSFFFFFEGGGEKGEGRETNKRYLIATGKRYDRTNFTAARRKTTFGNVRTRYGTRRLIIIVVFVRLVRPGRRGTGQSTSQKRIA